MNQVIELLQRHRSIRKFTPDPVSPEQIKAIVSSAQSASSSSNVQAYSIIGVTDAAMKNELASLSGNRHVAECPLFLVWCADLYRLRQACAKRGVEMVSGTLENFLVTSVDTALAAQNAAVAAESMGLGVVYIGGIRNQSREVTRLLKLPQLVYPVFGMCIGYPNHDPGVKPRLGMDVVYHENTYSSEACRDGIDAYDEVMRQYYGNRSSNNRDTTWTHDMAAKFERATRVHMRSFIEEQGFKLD